jgi:hypothetical protein
LAKDQIFPPVRLPEGKALKSITFLANLETNILIISAKDTPVDPPCPWGAKTVRNLKAS